MLKRDLFCFCLCVCILSGCAAIPGKIQALSGTSTKRLSAFRKSALAKDFPYQYKDCFNASLSVVSKFSAYVFKKDYVKGVIACYVSESDTTEIGIFLTEFDSQHTRIEVVSLNSQVQKQFAEKFFSALGQALSVDEKLNEVIRQYETDYTPDTFR